MTKEKVFKIMMEFSKRFEDSVLKLLPVTSLFDVFEDAEKFKEKYEGEISKELSHSLYLKEIDIVGKLRPNALPKHFKVCTDKLTDGIWFTHIYKVGSDKYPKLDDLVSYIHNDLMEYCEEQMKPYQG